LAAATFTFCEHPTSKTKYDGHDDGGKGCNIKENAFFHSLIYDTKLPLDKQARHIYRQIFAKLEK